MLTQQDYQEIRSWIHRNARPLDLALWKYHFEDGRREEISDAMAYYQNEDGGFGHGIEPDCWNRESSPYATMIAAGILRRTGFMEREGDKHPMVQGIFRYLESGVHCDEEGWLFCIPSNSECPRGGHTVKRPTKSRAWESQPVSVRLFCSMTAQNQHYIKEPNPILRLF